MSKQKRELLGHSKQTNPLRLKASFELNIMGQGEFWGQVSHVFDPFLTSWHGIGAGNSILGQMQQECVLHLLCVALEIP